MKKINICFLFFIFLTKNIYANDELNFAEWKKNFKNVAMENNISEITFDKVMSNVKFLPKVIKYDRYQPEFYEDTKTYVSKRTSKTKVKKGVSFYEEYSKIINEVEIKYKIECR